MKISIYGLPLGMRKRTVGADHNKSGIRVMSDKHHQEDTQTTVLLGSRDTFQTFSCHYSAKQSR